MKYLLSMEKRNSVPRLNKQGTLVEIPRTLMRLTSVDGQKEQRMKCFTYNNQEEHAGLNSI